jgi:hypothetical protein
VRDERVDHPDRRDADEEEVRVHRGERVRQQPSTSGPHRHRHRDDPEQHDGHRHQDRVVCQQSRHEPDPLMSVLYISCGFSPGFGGWYSFECFTINPVELNT